MGLFIFRCLHAAGWCWLLMSIWLFFLSPKNIYTMMLLYTFWIILHNLNHYLITVHLKMSKINTTTEPDWIPPISRQHSSHQDVNGFSCWSRCIHVVYQMANEAQLQGHDEGSGACPLLKWHLMGHSGVRTLGCHCAAPQWGHKREGGVLKMPLQQQWTISSSVH